MKNMVKVLVALVMAFSMVLGCVGVQAGSAAREEITITVLDVQAGTDYELKGTPVGDAIIAKTGVNVKVTHAIGDENETIALMIMSGDLPDIVNPHYNFGPFIEAGVALELTDMIEKYAPGYKTFLGENIWASLQWTKDNPGRYFLADPDWSAADSFDQFNWFFLQHDALIQQNYPKMETLADYEAVIAAYVAANPTTDGQPTIGMTLLCEDWRWIISLTNPAMMAAGTLASGEFYVNPDTHEVTYRILANNEKEYIRWLNSMYNKGLLDKEAFTQTLDQYKAKVATGRVVALTDMGWEFADAQTALRSEGKYNKMYGCYPIVIEEGIKNSAFSGPRRLESGSGRAMIMTSCAYPERVLELVEFFTSEEGQILNYWGVEGVHYDVVDGVRVVKPEEMEKRNTDANYGLKTGIGLLDFLPRYIDGIKDSTGQYYTTASKESKIANYTEVDKQVLAAYNARTWADLFPQASEFPIRQWPENISLPAESDGAVAFQKCMDVVKKDVINAIIVAPDAFDAAWAKFEQDMVDAGVQVYEDAVTAGIKEKMAIWGMEFVVK